MSVLKLLLIVVLAATTITVVGGYFYVKKRFTPEKNELQLTNSSNKIPIKWVSSDYSDYAAILLPVKLEKVPLVLYTQFDTGTPSTVMYKNKLLGILEKYPDVNISFSHDSAYCSFSFFLGEMKVQSKKIKVLDIGEKPAKWTEDEIIRIGTIGADLIEKRVTVLDMVKHCCYFGDYPEAKMDNPFFNELVIKGRRTLFPGKILGKKRKFIHDSGSSGFELITNKKTWTKMIREGTIPKESFKVKSWKRQLTAYNAEANASIDFEGISVKLGKVTYIEGASIMQVLLMRMTGMGGMIGNELFLGKRLVLDCPNKRYALIESPSP